MNVHLKYGKGHKEFNIPDKNVLKILKMKHIASASEPEKHISSQLQDPINSPSFKKLLTIKKPQNIVIIVSDITRPGPFTVLLKILLNELLANGIPKENIHIVIANGTHRKMTEKEMRYHYGDWAIDNFSIENHDCRANDLVYLGTMRSGNKLHVNKRVAEADFRITVGIVNPHYFAGFSGGRKSILPGVSGYETIRCNHSNIVHDYAFLGNVEQDNKIHTEMSEAAALLGVDFTLQAILNEKKELVRCFAGALEETFYVGVKYFRENSSVKFSQKADAVIVSAGGFPKDLNFYQSQKALNATINLVKTGGTLVLVTECPNNIEQDEMEKQLKNAKSIDELLVVDQKKIQIGGHRAFATGRLLKQAEILVISEMDPELVKAVHFIPISSIKKAIEYITQKEGEDFTCYIVPSGGMFFPVEINK